MLARILYYYYKTLYLERSIKTAEQLAHYQEKQFKKLIKNTLSKSLFYRSYLDKPLHEWPIINKAIMMEQFDEINTVGIKKKEALTCA
ncbi:MAG: F390 synthetase-related protein, partial [Legionella sp.]